MLKNSLSLSNCVLFSLIAVTGCQGQTDSAETEAAKGKSPAEAKICIVNGNDFEDDSAAQKAPVTLSDGSKSSVGAGIKVTVVSGYGSGAGVKAKVHGGAHAEKTVTFQQIHLKCPQMGGSVGGKSIPKPSGSGAGSAKGQIPWANPYFCNVQAKSSENAAFKGSDGTVTYVGNGYEVAIPSGEINNTTVNVYVLKGGVIAAGSRGSMQKADLSDCVEDKSI